MDLETPKSEKDDVRYKCAYCGAPLPHQTSKMARRSAGYVVVSFDSASVGETDDDLLKDTNRSKRKQKKIRCKKDTSESSGAREARAAGDLQQENPRESSAATETN